MVGISLTKSPRNTPATSLDELPRPLVPALPGYTLHVLVDILDTLSARTPNRTFSAVRQLSLAKKPLMPEPYLQRLEMGVVQECRDTRQDLRRAMAAEHFTYHCQLSGQMMACRLLLAGCATQNGAVGMVHFDKANAFCNPGREGDGSRNHKAPEQSLLR